MEEDCPFCGNHPFEYVDIGVGYQPVAVTCCGLGDLYYRGARPEPETVTLSWSEFRKLGDFLGSVRASLKHLETTS